MQGGVERFEAEGHGPDAARGFGGIDHQHYRQTEQFGELGRAARLVVPGGAIVQPHDALDHGHILADHGAMK